MIPYESGSIYYESDEEISAQGLGRLFCPDKTTVFINELLKKNFSIILINTVHPSSTIKEKFLKIIHPHIWFVDCISSSMDEKHLGERNEILANKSISLTNLNLIIKKLWGEINGKKCLFFESGSSLFMKHKEEEVFEFIHTLILDYNSEGMVVFKFIKGGIDEKIERQLKYFFDIILHSTFEKNIKVPENI